MKCVGSIEAVLRIAYSNQKRSPSKLFTKLTEFRTTKARYTLCVGFRVFAFWHHFTTKVSTYLGYKNDAVNTYLGYKNDAKTRKPEKFDAKTRKHA